MTRRDRLDQVLRCIMGDDGAPETPSTGEGAFGRGLACFRALCAGDIDEAYVAAVDALALARDDDAVTLARAVTGLVIAHSSTALDDDRLVDPRCGGGTLDAARDEALPLDPELSAALRVLLVEAALACARIDLAADFLDDSLPPPRLFGDDRHPFFTFMRLTMARVSLFSGDVSGAQRLVDDAIAGASTPLGELLARSASALVLGRSDQRKQTREIVDVISSGALEPIGLIPRGCYVLAAYGAVALDDYPRAVQLMLRGGGGPSLDALRIIDRVMGLELLVTAAALEHDLDAATSWLAQAVPLEHHPIAESTVARMRARVALLAHDSDSALNFASSARERAQVDGRGIEAADAAVLIARARIDNRDRGGAARGLADAARAARESGHQSFLRAASRELRAIGRRLPPGTASGMLGLSPRERDVAQLMAEGLSNAGIAKTLFVSEHTVRTHVARVLHAFGVSSRAGVARALAPVIADDVPQLTPRQREIVALLVEGCTNQQIAHALDIGVSTVEKHIADVLRRWHVSSRAGIVRVAASRQPSLHSEEAP